MDIVLAKVRKLLIYHLKNETVKKKPINCLKFWPVITWMSTQAYFTLNPMSSFLPFSNMAPSKDHMLRCLKSHSQEVKAEVLILEQQIHWGTCSQMKYVREWGRWCKVEKSMTKICKVGSSSCLTSAWPHGRPQSTNGHSILRKPGWASKWMDQSVLGLWFLLGRGGVECPRRL